MIIESLLFQKTSLLTGRHFTCAAGRQSVSTGPSSKESKEMVSLGRAVGAQIAQEMDRLTSHFWQEPPVVSVAKKKHTGGPEV